MQLIHYILQIIVSCRNCNWIFLNNTLPLSLNGPTNPESSTHVPMDGSLGSSHLDRDLPNTLARQGARYLLYAHG